MSQTNTVFVLGGDGLIGWPLSLRLSSLGFSVVIVDNLVRRDIDVELQVESLVPIQSIESRLQAWKEVSGKEIKFVQLDLANDFQSLLELVKTEKPSTIFDLVSICFSFRFQFFRSRCTDCCFSVMLGETQVCSLFHAFQSSSGPNPFQQPWGL